jgi:hypothetical protein
MRRPLGGKWPIADLRRRARQGFDWYQGSQNQACLDAFPAQELFQGIQEPSPVDWSIIWPSAGGKLFAGKMLALKSDPIWQRISRFGLPYPPFDEYDLMDVRDIGYTEAVSFGLLMPGQRQAPQNRKWIEDSKRIRRGGL